MAEAFDWVEFLEQRGVEYVTAGPNISQNEVGVACPFCGRADPSQHLAINLAGRGWICRRCRKGGVSPIALIRELIGCTLEEARRIAGARGALSSNELLGQVEDLLGEGSHEEDSPSSLQELRAFKKFGTGLPSSIPYTNYMVRRGFSKKFLKREATGLGLRYCSRGPLGGRIMFLVHRGGSLINWTGRSIHSSARLRYRALSADPEVAERSGLPVASVPIERCLLWEDDLRIGGPELFLVEGPMDALKLRSLGKQATCVFTASPSSWQVDLLRELAPGFKRRIILLDRGAEAQTLGTARELVALGFCAGWLPGGVEDPGELTAKLVQKIRY